MSVVQTTPSNPGVLPELKEMNMTNKQSALVRAGIRPVDWGKRKGTQAHTNRRRADRMGVTKHKNRDWS